MIATICSTMGLKAGPTPFSGFAGPFLRPKGLLAQNLDRCLEEFITLGIMIVSFTRRRTEGYHQILLLKSELRPDTGVRSKSRNIDVFLDTRVFHDLIRVALESRCESRFRNH